MRDRYIGLRKNISREEEIIRSVRVLKCEFRIDDEGKRKKQKRIDRVKSNENGMIFLSQIKME